MSEPSTEIEAHRPQQLATVPDAPSIGAMLQAAMERGITAENVGVLEKMMDLYERDQKRRAEIEFNRAFVALQSELPQIVATSIIPNRGKYEKYEDLMVVVGPLLFKHGFTPSFSMDVKDGRVVETCHLKHVSGHSQSNSFAVRTGKADSDTQADCKAATTAKRYAFSNSINLVVRQDALSSEEEDASIEGSFIKPDQAVYLRELVRDTKSDEKAFLAFAGASVYEEISSSKYDRLVSALHKKQKGS